MKISKLVSAEPHSFLYNHVSLEATNFLKKIVSIKSVNQNVVEAKLDFFSFLTCNALWVAPSIHHRKALATKKQFAASVYGELWKTEGA